MLDYQTLCLELFDIFQGHCSKLKGVLVKLTGGGFSRQTVEYKALMEHAYVNMRQMSEQRAEEDMVVPMNQLCTSLRIVMGLKEGSRLE